ncbi:hypothetical protein [Confluentibacter citreus]|uniref:hypothetical protein n=1 Tax=Confluentibacter citreus TaxID=2007307 RepID=UPI0012FD4B4E|nr:hypothetical protein [Confluentibacter citreus]
MKTGTYKLNLKSIFRLIRTNLIILFLLYILNHYFLKVYNPTVILISIGHFFVLFNGPAIYLLINYYRNNKKTEFSIDENSNKISITENGITKKYSLNDIKYSIYNLGKYWQNAIDKNYRIPTIFSDFGYWDLTFENGDRYYLTTLLHDFLLEEDKVNDTKYRFRLIPYIDKSETEKGIELKPIEYKPKSTTEKLKESYKGKTNEELKYIIENKSKYQKEAIKVAEEILKEKNVG